MPQVDTTPDFLKPYHFHGVELADPKNGEAIGDCPFCGREGKFSVNAQEKPGQWKCWGCNENGNATVFCRLLHDMAVKATTEEEYEALRIQRYFLYTDTFRVWQVCRSPLTGNWLIPGYSVEGALNQLYQYIKFPDRWKLLPTNTLNHQLHGVNLYDPAKPNVMVSEGPWDGMKAYEVMRRAKDVEGKLMTTGNEKASLYSQFNILPIPGCKTFFKWWSPLFAGKNVYFPYDNDHPGVNPKTGARVAPAGLEGVKYAANILNAAEKPPAAMYYLQWSGSYEVDHCPSLPAGFDFRDALGKGLSREHSA